MMESKRKWKANEKMKNHLLKDSEEKPAKRTKKSKYTLTPEKEKNLEGKNARPHDAKFPVAPLSYEQVVEGMLSLGIIRRIEHHQISVSLPGGTAGVVSITNISTPYLELLEQHAEEEATVEDGVNSLKQMFHERQYVVVKVLSVNRSGETVKVHLSMNPKDLYGNYNTSILSDNLVMVAAVKSEEDHGFVMDVGINGATCFLPKNATNYKRFGIGQLIYCKIQSVKMNRLLVKVTLKALPTSVWTYKMDGGGGLSLDTLIPGMLVDGVVMKAEVSGAMVRCLGLDSLVHQDHMNGKWDKPESLTVGSTVSARVLYTLPHLTTLYLSLNCEPAPLKICKDGTEDKVGTKQTVRIVSCGTRGIVVRFSDDNKGIVSLNHIGDDSLLTKEDIAKMFTVGSEHVCAVLKYNAMDRMHLCSFKKHLLEGDVFHFRNALPGMKVNCEIEKWNKGGALVRFGEGVRGFIPSSLFANSNLSSMSKDQSWRHDLIGKRVAARIMYRDDDEEKIILATRKEFVNSKGVVLSSFDEAKVGMIGHGWIKKFNKGVMEVQAIGGLKGSIYVAMMYEIDLRILRAMERTQIEPSISFRIIGTDALTRKVLMQAILDDNQSTEVKENITVPKARLTLSCGNIMQEVNGVQSTSRVDKKQRKHNRKNKPSSKNDLKNKTEMKDENMDVSPFHNLIIEPSVDDDEEENLDLFFHEGIWCLPVQSIADSDNERSFNNQEGKEQEADPVDVQDAEIPIRNELRLVDASPQPGDLIKEFEEGIIPSPNVASYWINLMTEYKTSGNMDKARVVSMQGVDELDDCDENGKITIWRALLDFEFINQTPMAKLKDMFQEACRKNDEFFTFWILAQALGEFKRTHSRRCAEKEYSNIRKESDSTWEKFFKFYHRLQKLESPKRQLFKELFSKHWESLSWREMLPYRITAAQIKSDSEITTFFKDQEK